MDNFACVITMQKIRHSRKLAREIPKPDTEEEDNHRPVNEYPNNDTHDELKRLDAFVPHVWIEVVRLVVHLVDQIENR